MPKVLLLAWCPTATLYLDALCAAGAPPVLAVTGAHTSAASALAEACARAGVALRRSDDVNAPGLVDILRGLGLDLIVVAGCAQVLKAPLLATARLGAVNFHPSLLPAYRGREPLFWAILRGETRVGVTAHVVTPDLDAGPILFAREVPVPPRATSASLARDVDAAGATFIPELLAMAASGPLRGRAPSGPGSHVPPLREEHGILDFTRSAAELDRLVRAATGELYAYTFLGGTKLVVLAADAAPPCPGALPGEVLSVDPSATLVATTDGALVVKEWLFLARAVTGPELGELVGLRPGVRLGPNPAF